MFLMPPKLKPGAHIGIVSPASKPLNSEKFQRGIEYLKQRGFSVTLGAHASDEHGYLAGTDEARASDLNAMFRNSSIDAIICSRGGYGTPRILNRLDYPAIQANPKIFVGYSDITALQHAIQAQTGLITFSGPMVAVEMGGGIDPFTETHFWELLEGKTTSLCNLPEMGFQVLRPGVAEGFLIGGCLSVLAGVIGTPFMPDYTNGILVLEDIDEEPYGIDRNLCQLKAAGILDQVRAIVFGQFIDSNPKDPEKPSLSINQVIEELTKDLTIPIITNYPYGHGSRKYTLPWGAHVRLNPAAGIFELVDPALV
jgi:muramoyltetrapeptide carboxypeptidase